MNRHPELQAMSDECQRLRERVDHLGREVDMLRATVAYLRPVAAIAEAQAVELNELRTWRSEREAADLRHKPVWAREPGPHVVGEQR